MDLSGFHDSLPKVSEPSKMVCAVCQAAADKFCSACHKVAYCSAQHQKSHWKVHEKDCPPIKIVNSPELGPHFVATRNLPPWSLLLTELPVLINPVVFSGNPWPYPFKSCITCRSILPSAPWPCFQCSTPYFCNLSCSMNKIHTEFDCGILFKCSEEQKEKLCKYPSLGHLRAFHLKNKDPETWAKVMEISGSNQHKPGNLDENDKWFIREILPLIGKNGVGYKKDMAKLRGIFQQKGIAVGMIDISPDGSRGHGESHLIYLEASNLTQNCFPNCAKIIGKGPSFQLQIRSTVRIKKGTILSIDYLRVVTSGIGAISRQRELHQSKTPLCICPRCTDPTGTELGSMLSAVRCEEPNCKDGYLLPVDIRDLAENAPWRCNGAGCKGKGSTWGEINEFILRFEDEIPLQDLIPLANVEQKKEYLASLEKKLHPDHWLILCFKHRATEKIFFEPDMYSIPGLQLYISMIDDLLRMAEFTAPGPTTARVRLWHKLLSLLMPILTEVLYGRRNMCKELEKEFKRRAIEAIDQFCSIAKLYPELYDFDDLIKNFKGEIRQLLQLSLLRQLASE